MKIVLIGAGNAGFHLGCRLKECGEDILQVFSRNLLHAKELGEKIEARFIDDLDQTDRHADLYILAVHDDAIAEVAEKLATLGLREKFVVHTSGATPKTVFENTGLLRYGVFYPLQTFSKKRRPDFTQIPLCIDADLEADLEILRQLAQKISPNVFVINDEERAVLHVAAVFVNNFANHLFHAGHTILTSENLPFDLLLPLMRETVAKLEAGTPADMQTGPAIRGDEATIRRHLTYLKKFPQFAGLYRTLTESIRATGSE